MSLSFLRCKTGTKPQPLQAAWQGSSETQYGKATCVPNAGGAGGTVSWPGKTDATCIRFVHLKKEQTKSKGLARTAETSFLPDKHTGTLGNGRPPAQRASTWKKKPSKAWTAFQKEAMRGPGSFRYREKLSPGSLQPLERQPSEPARSAIALS